MTRTEIEAAYVARLKGLAPTGVLVAPSPEDPNEWSKVGPKGCIYCRYMGSTPMEVAVNVPNPRRTMKMLTYIGKKNLRSKGEAHIGAYELLDLVDAALTGWTIDPDPDNRLWLNRGTDGFYTETNGVWWYLIEHTSNPYKLTLPKLP